MDTYQRIQELTALIYALAIIVTLLCAYIVRLPSPPDETVTMCPLHRSDAKTCRRYHKDD